MNPNGVMAEIRGLLQQGKSSTEVITLGYAPSSVYKAQRQLRKTNERPDPPVTQVVVTNMAPEGWGELKEENANLRQQLSRLEELEAERDTLREDLGAVRGHIEELEAQAIETQQLRERLSEVEAEARAAGELRQEVGELISQIKQTKATMGHEAHRWEARLSQEQEARESAEALAITSRSEIEKLKAENQEMARLNQEMPDRISQTVWQLIQPLQQELEELRPLRVWTGHPCSSCGQPTFGVPSRETAAKLLRSGGYGHGHCIKGQNWW